MKSKRMSVKMKNKSEYLRRNEIVAQSFGVIAGISSIERRLLLRSRKPKWLLVMLSEIKQCAESVKDESVKHRNEKIGERSLILDAMKLRSAKHV